MNLFHHKSKIERSEKAISSFTFQMIITYSCFLFAALILLSAVFEIQQRNSEKEYWSQYKVLFENSAKVSDSQFELMDSFARLFTTDDNFFRLVNFSDTSDSKYYFTALKAKNSFSSQLYVADALPVDSYYVFLQNTDHILSVRLFQQSRLFFTGKRKYLADKYDTWLSYVSDTELTYQFHSLSGFSLDKNKNLYIFILNMNATSYRNFPASMCYEINPDKFCSNFSDLGLDDGASIIICDSDNNEAMRLGSTDTCSSLDADLVSSLNYDNDQTFYRSPDGESLCISRFSSPDSYFSYYLMQPVSFYSGGFSAITIIILGAAIGFGILLVAWLVARSVKPLKEISSQLTTVKTDRDQLKEEILEQKPLICETYVRRLFTGSVQSKSEMNYITDFLGYPASGIKYHVLYIVMYNNYPEKAAFDYDGEAKVEQIIASAFSFKLPVYVCSIKEHSYAVLTAFSENEESVFTLQEHMLSLHNEMLENHSIWMYAGLGNSCANPMNIWESYQQSADAVNYSTNAYIFLPYEVIKKDSNRYYYPAELSEKMIHFITTGNKDQIVELFSLIHQENIEERALPINILKFLLSDIRNTILKARFTLPPDKDDELSEFDSLMNTVLSFRQYKDLAVSLSSYFSEVPDSEDIILSIQKYIQDNFSDPSLSLTKISDEFKISESYFSHLFKDRMGINFSVYLENLRLKEACKLIESKSCNISDLYIKVGYNNASSFRRAFKKNFGMPPSSYKA